MRFKNGIQFKTMGKKIVKKYVELIHRTQQATGRKEAVGLIHKAAKVFNTKAN